MTSEAMTTAIGGAIADAVDDQTREVFCATIDIAAFTRSLAEQGYQVVPVEPTKEMVLAGDDALEERSAFDYNSLGDGPGSTYLLSDVPATIYRAMLSAVK